MGAGLRLPTLSAFSLSLTCLLRVWSPPGQDPPVQPPHVFRDLQERPRIPGKEEMGARQQRRQSHRICLLQELCGAFRFVRAQQRRPLTSLTPPPVLSSERGARGQTLHRGGGRQHLAEQRRPWNAGQHGRRRRSRRHGERRRPGACVGGSAVPVECRELCFSVSLGRPL